METFLLMDAKSFTS